MKNALFYSDYFQYNKSIDKTGIHKAIAFLKNIVCYYDISNSNEMFVMLSEDDEINRSLVRQIVMFKKIKGKETINFLGLKPKDQISSFLQNNTKISYRYFSCECDIYDALVRLYSLLPRNEYLYVSDYRGAFDINCRRLLENSAISLDQIVSEVFLDLPYTASQCEIDFEASRLPEKKELKIEPVWKIEKIEILDHEILNHDEYIQICSELVRRQYVPDENKHWFIFGSMKTTYELLDQLTEIPFEGIIDNSPSKQGTICHGLEVLAPIKVKEHFGEAVRVVVPSHYYAEMSKQLIELGYSVDEHIIIAYAKGNPLLGVITELEKCVENTYSQGEMIYNKTFMESGNYCLIVNPLCGEEFIVLQYIKSVKSYEECKIVSSNKTLVNSLMSNDIQATFVNLSSEEERNLIGYLKCEGDKKKNICVIGGLSFQEPLLKLLYIPNESIANIYKECIFKNYNVENNNPEVIPLNYDQINRIVLCAQSDVDDLLSLGFWNLLANHFINLGFSVFTLMMNEDSELIAGTEPLVVFDESFGECFSESDYLISSRNYFSEIFAGLSIYKVFLYPIDEDRTDVLRNKYFYSGSLRRMGLCDDRLLEIRYEKNNLTTISNSIVSHIVHLNEEKHHEAEIAVVICNYNGGKEVMQCIEHILNSNRSDYHIILVDNCSTDESSKAIQDKYGNLVHIIWNEENMGGAGGFAAGLSYALEKGYPYIMAVDHDAFLDVDTMTMEYEYLISHNDVGIVSPKVYYYDQPFAIQDYNSRIAWDRYAIYIDPREEDLYCEKTCDFCPTTAAMMRREALEKSGGMDPSYFIYFDDVEMSQKMKISGFKCVSLGTAKAWHKGGQLNSRIRSTFAKYYFDRNRYRFFAKYIAENDIERFVEYILKESFNQLYGAYMKGDEESYKICRYIFHDFLCGRKGKAPGNRIYELHNKTEEDFRALMNVEHKNVDDIFMFFKFVFEDALRERIHEIRCEE